MKATEKGYMQVSPAVMISQLTSEQHRFKLRLVQLHEIERIDKNLKKYSTVPENYREYLTSLYIDVVLNNVTYVPSKRKVFGRKTKKVKSTPQHIGMIKYLELIKIK